jgi:predicted nucleotidyltransferase
MKSNHLNIKRLAKGLEESFPEILFAFLFGSSKEGKIKPGSDVDLAIYIQETKDKFTMISHILKTVESEISTDNLDLVVLNDTSPVLAMEALNGKILFIRKEAMDNYADFYSLTCRLYEDHIFWTKKQLEYRGYEVQWDN